MGNIHLKLFETSSRDVLRRCFVENSIFLKLSWPFCLAEWKLLYNFGRGHYGKHSSDFFIKFGPVVQE